MSHALEVLRVSATILVILYHASLTYISRPLRLTLWHVYDTATSQGFDVFIYWVNGFVMPLFFLAAGVSVPAACQARGAAEFLKHRTRRLLRPLLFGSVAILPLTYVIWAYGLIVTGRCDEGQILSWRYSPEIRTHVYGFLHLWFLEYLFLVCVVWAAGWTLLRRWKLGEQKSAASENGPHAWLTTIWRPLLPALATAAIFLIDSDTMLRVDNTFIPSPTRLIHYLLFFMVGAWISQLNDPKERLIPRSFLYVILSFVTFAALTPLLLRHAAEPLVGTERLVFCALAALFPWLTIFGALGMLLRFVQDRGPAMRFLAEASFWVYIIHVPLVALFQVLLLPFAWPPVVKFLIVSAAALLLSLLSYEYLVRRSLIGEIVNGTKKRSKLRRWPGPEFGWVATVVVVVGSTLWGVWTLRSFFFGENFHVVVQGQVYRSSRLKPADLGRQIQRHGIRTVIAINTDGSQHFWVKEQRQLCEQRNVGFTCVTIPGLEAPSAQSMVDLVRRLDNCPRPILIEGQRGVRNVSFASAVARLLDGAPPRDALREFSAGYGEFTALDHSALAEPVLGYGEWLNARRKVHSASEFREWTTDRCRVELRRASTVANDTASSGFVR